MEGEGGEVLRISIALVGFVNVEPGYTWRHGLGFVRVHAGKLGGVEGFDNASVVTRRGPDSPSSFRRFLGVGKRGAKINDVVTVKVRGGDGGGGCEVVSDDQIPQVTENLRSQRLKRWLDEKVVEEDRRLGSFHVFESVNETIEGVEGDGFCRERGVLRSVTAGKVNSSRHGCKAGGDARALGGDVRREVGDYSVEGSKQGLKVWKGFFRDLCEVYARDGVGGHGGLVVSVRI